MFVNVIVSQIENGFYIEEMLLITKLLHLKNKLRINESENFHVQ